MVDWKNRDLVDKNRSISTLDQTLATKGQKWKLFTNLFLNLHIETYFSLRMISVCNAEILGFSLKLYAGKGSICFARICLNLQWTRPALVHLSLSHHPWGRFLRPWSLTVVLRPSPFLYLGAPGIRELPCPFLILVTIHFYLPPLKSL